MKKQTIIIALLLLMAASPAAAVTGTPSVRGDIKTDIKTDVRVEGQVQGRMTDRVADRLTDFGTRLERLEVRIATLIKRLEAKKVDMADSKTAFVDFSAKLDIAQKNLGDLSAYLNASGGATIDMDQLNAKRKATRESLQEAHAALKLTVKEIAEAIRSTKTDAEVKVRADVNASAEAN